MSTRIAINGFGRMGRQVLRIALERDDVEVVGVNDLGSADNLAYLFRYDSVHGRYKDEVRVESGALRIGDRSVPFFSERDPKALPWKEREAEIVIESTGVFTQRAAAAGHLEAGAKKVIISAPSKDPDATFVMGVNEDRYDAGSHHVVSMASCTTNCIAPVARVLDESFGIEHMMITTVHAYTSTQALVDIPIQKDFRRGRAAAVSIIPSSTGAAKATGLVLPQLQGRMDGMALRVPVPDGSVTDMVATLGADTTSEAVNEAIRAAGNTTRMKGILTVSEDPLVSADIVGDPHSSIVDAQSTIMLGSRMVKVLSWYDNEWGYSTRLVDFARFLAS